MGSSIDIIWERRGLACVLDRHESSDDDKRAGAAAEHEQRTKRGGVGVPQDGAGGGLGIGKRASQ